MLDTQTADKNTQIAGTYVIYSKYFQSFICFIFHLCDDAELIFSWCHYIFVTNVCLRSDLCRNPPHCAALWVNILSLPFLFVYQTDSPSYKAADVVSSSFSITWRKGRKTRTHDLAHIVFSHACCQCTHSLAQTKLEPLLLSSTPSSSWCTANVEKVSDERRALSAHTTMFRSAPIKATRTKQAQVNGANPASAVRLSSEHSRRRGDISPQASHSAGSHPATHCGPCQPAKNCSWRGVNAVYLDTHWLNN